MKSKFPFFVFIVLVFAVNCVVANGVKEGTPTTKEIPKKMCRFVLVNNTKNDIVRIEWTKKDGVPKEITAAKPVHPGDSYIIDIEKDGQDSVRVRFILIDNKKSRYIASGADGNGFVKSDVDSMMLVFEKKTKK